MQERLQKIISAAGLMSRRAAETYIEQGRVQVNGKPAALGDKADPETDSILVDGRPLPKVDDKLYIVLNKPRGYVTTLHDEKGRKSVVDLVSDLGTRVYPVGRLDMDSEGLLLLTNDGAFANRLMHPSHEIDKTYHTWVTGEHLEKSCEILRKPMVMDGYRIKPAKVLVLKEEGKEAVLSITIHEGRNRQIRRMCEKAGLQVTRLCRISEGPVKLGKLPAGKWRYLTAQELRQMGEDL